MITVKNKKFVIRTVLVSLFLVFVIYIMMFQFRAGVQVTIKNTGTTTLRSVVLYVTGSSYGIGDIAPEHSVKTTVNPTSESHLEIEFIDSDGQVHRLNAGGYFESDYHGTIQISIKDGVIEKNKQDILIPGLDIQ